MWKCAACADSLAHDLRWWSSAALPSDSAAVRFWGDDFAVVAVDVYHDRAVRRLVCVGDRLCPGVWSEKKCSDWAGVSHKKVWGVEIATMYTLTHKPKAMTECDDMGLVC